MEEMKLGELCWEIAYIYAFLYLKTERLSIQISGNLFAVPYWDSSSQCHYNVIYSGSFVMVPWACLKVSEVQIIVKICTSIWRYNFKEVHSTSISHERCLSGQNKLSHTSFHKDVKTFYNTFVSTDQSQQ